MVRYIILDFELKDSSQIERGIFKKWLGNDESYLGQEIQQVLGEDFKLLKILDTYSDEILEIELDSSKSELIESLFTTENCFKGFLGLQVVCPCNQIKGNYVLYISGSNHLPEIFVGYDCSYMQLLSIYGNNNVEDLGSQSISKEYIANNEAIFKNIPCYYLEIEMLHRLFQFNRFKGSTKAKLFNLVNMSCKGYELGVNEGKPFLALTVNIEKGYEKQGIEQLQGYLIAQADTEMELVACEKSVNQSESKNLVTYVLFVDLKGKYKEKYFSKSNVYDVCNHYNKLAERIIE